MRNTDYIIKMALKETLQEKAEELKSKLKKTNMDEWTPNAPVTIQGTDVHEVDVDMDIESRLCDEDSDEYDEERCRYNKKAKSGNEFEMDEELIGGQKKLDKNKNGKLDKEDFKMLRKDRSEGKEVCSECGRKMYEGECSECGMGKMYENMDEEMEEGNAFTGALEKARKEGDSEFEVGGKKFHVKEAKESLRLSEEEMITLIENIVREEKKAKGMAETEKVLKADKKENDQYIKDVTKKMKDYLKNMSKGEYNMNPEIFPKGNGELAKMEKMAYVPSEAVDEYVDAFAHPGQTNLTFDEIKPDDEKIKKYLKGHSKTGNSQEYGNAVKSDVGEKLYKNYEDNLYGAEQMDASYKRQPQPVDVANNTREPGSLKSIRGKNSAKKAQKVLDKVDESTKKKEKTLSEEFNKMKHLIGYDKKTQ